MGVFVDVWVRAGKMTETEADAWRERIRVWQRFRRSEEPEQPFAGRSSFFAEEPNPFGLFNGP